MTVQQVLQRTGMQTPAPTATAQDAKLVHGAEEFEAMMLNQMLKPLQFGAGVDAGGEESTGGAAETIRGMGTEALGKALAAHGGLGFARKIIEEVTREQKHIIARKGESKVI